MSGNNLQRIFELSRYNGEPFGRLSLFTKGEEDSRRLADNHGSLRDYNVLIKAIMCLYLETMESCSALINQTSQQWHQFVVEKISWGFLSTRAAENVAREGYPWQGVTMLRDVHDRFILLSACLQEPAGFPTAMGISDDDDDFCPDRARKLRKNFEMDALQRMTGPQSRLSNECQSYLAKVKHRYN